MEKGKRIGRGKKMNVKGTRDNDKKERGGWKIHVRERRKREAEKGKAR